MNRENDGKKTLKSGMYYMIANIISMIVSLITLSLLSNLMTTSDMGISTSFITLQTVLSYICLLSIYTSINRILLEKDIDVDEYFSTITIFSVGSVILYYVVYLFFQDCIYNILGFDINIMSFLFLSILFENVFLYLYTKWNFYNNYIKCFLYNIITSPISQILSLLLVYLFNNKYWGRIIGLKSIPIIFGFIITFYILYKGKYKFNKKYLKFGLLLSIPIVSHLLAQIILSNSDLLMIKGMVGSSEAGIYSVAYTIGNVLFMTVSCILKPWSPWVYRRMENNEVDAIYKNSKYIILINFILSIGLITIAPEMIKLFLNHSYIESMYLISPICLGMFFQGIYILFYDIEYYHKKNKNIALYSIFAAILNIVLNFIFIRIYGYIAAAYTTFLSYLLLSVAHYIGMKKIEKRKIFNINTILFYSLLLIVLAFVNLIYINSISIRYILFVLIIIILFIIERNQIKSIFELFIGKKINSRNIQLKLIPFYRYVIFTFDNIVKKIVKIKQKNISNKKQVIIVSNLGIGDAMDFICIANKYNKLYPSDKYEITLLCSKVSYDLLRNETKFDNYIIMDMNTIFSNSLNLIQRIKAIKTLREKEYDILIDQMWPFTILPANLFVSNIIPSNKKINSINVASLQIPKKYISKVYSNVNEVNNIKLTNIEMYNSVPMYISKLIGVQIDNSIKYKKIKPIKLRLKLPENYYLVFPSSTSDKKNWEYEKYVKIIIKIYKKIKIPVIFCGTKNDSTAINEITKKLDDNMYINILGKTDILEFIQVIKNSKFVITNDTGAYHIAVINEVPVTIITGGYTYDSFVTYNFKDNNYKKPYVVVDNKKCFNCHLNCIYSDDKKFPCLSSITVNNAWKIIEKMIDNDYLKNERGDKNERNN